MYQEAHFIDRWYFLMDAGIHNTDRPVLVYI